MRQREVGSWVLSFAADAKHLLLGPKLGRSIVMLRKADGRVVWKTDLLGVPDELVLDRKGSAPFAACSTTCGVRYALLKRAVDSAQTRPTRSS